MIVGSRNFARDTLWYVQATMSQGAIVPKSAIENILMLDDIQDATATTPVLWLETCKCHSNYNAALATRCNPDTFENDVAARLRGVRPPDYLCIWINTPQNRGALGIGAAPVIPSENSEVYPKAMNACFGVANDYHPEHTWEDLVAWLKAKCAVVGSRIAGTSGHAIMFKAYDDGTGEVIYVDPLTSHDPEHWANMRMKKNTHDAVMKGFVNVYPPEPGCA